MSKERILKLLLKAIEKPPILTAQPSRTLQDIFDYVRRQYAREDNIRKPIVGIVFARPESKIAKDEIIPNIKYFDVRSGQNIDFFFPGYVEAKIDQTSKHKLFVGGKEWIFDDEMFNIARHSLEGLTIWTYSGEADLLLANVRSINKDAGHFVDFSRVLKLDLDKMIRDKSIESIPRLFEQISHFAEHNNAFDPVGTFSDYMGWRIGKKSMVSGMWDRLKFLIAMDLRALQDFAVKDVTR